jgi:cytochrome c oxidase subunit III
MIDGRFEMMNTRDIQSSRNARLEEERQARELDLKNKRCALLLWRFANGGIFVFFVLANYLMRQTQTTWPPTGVSRLDVTIPAIITLALLVSSWTATRVMSAMKRDNRSAVQQNILITLGLGLAFLIGIALVWQQVPHSGSYSAIFFTMTGFHAVHVLVGMLLFGYVYRKVRSYSIDHFWSLEAAVVFWHFVDLMWLLYFVVLYIL